MEAGIRGQTDDQSPPSLRSERTFKREKETNLLIYGTLRVGVGSNKGCPWQEVSFTEDLNVNEAATLCHTGSLKQASLVRVILEGKCFQNKIVSATSWTSTAKQRGRVSNASFLITIIGP